MIRLFICFFLSLYAIATIAEDKIANNNQPIEITSDRLEVIQIDKLAIFSGNVNVKNADMNVQADIIRVHYQVTQDQAGNRQSSLSEVEAIGNVFFKTLNEQVKSDNGKYELADNIITLYGNVSLLSGKNVVKGEKLVYNLSTGKSSLISENSSQNQENKQRVKGVFMPGG